jgi:ectoine hydroxylase-related dioxygenase (phytanoyl-CoA dioxygenase family)
MAVKVVTDLILKSDYHPTNAMMPVMIGCVTALTKTTKANGATVAIPGSHLWGPDRRPLKEEAVPAELNPGDAFIFVGNLYHAGGSNITRYANFNMLHASSFGSDIP